MTPELEKFLRSRNLEKVLVKATAPFLDDRKIERVEIIVLKYKSPEMEKDCISRIIQYTKHPYKLNVFDNRGNGPNTSKAWNKLIKESTCDYILFIDSDAFVQDTIGMINGVRHEEGVCWLSEMMKAFRGHDRVGIVGPVAGNNAVTTIQSMAPKDLDPFPIEGHLSGYCFLTKKSIYEEAGYFDEDFCFYGQESDWIERLLEDRKYKVVIAPRAHVTHGYPEQGGSQAAKQAEEEGEMRVEEDAAYSYYIWNLKKQERMRASGKNYEFKI